MTTVQTNDYPLMRAARSLRVVAWASVAALAVYFVAKNALPYLDGRGRAAKVFADNARLVYVHIFAGMGAVFAGFLQFQTGLQGKYRQLHRWVGRCYLISIALGSASAAVLVFSAHGNWVYASGLAALTIAWLTTSGLAFAAIRRGNVPQHREWMMRSYIVTFGFVTFRLVVNILLALHVGTRVDRLAFASWFCWAAPLLVAELILQGRKIFVVSPDNANRMRSVA